MDVFEKAVSENKTIAGVLRSLGRACTGSNYTYVKKECDRRGLSTDHWLGQRHGMSRPKDQVPLEELLIKGTRVSGLKRRLIRAGLLKYECADCGLIEWRGKRLSLHLDHKNGDREDNRLENLRLLCPNCHSLTETYCGKNSKLVRVPKTCACGAVIAWHSTQCHNCVAKQKPTKIKWPAPSRLLVMVQRKSVVTVAKMLGVSDTAVIKRMRNYPPKRRICS